MNRELEKRLEQLEKENLELRVENAKLLSIILHLEERLNLNSENSHKPPSSDRQHHRPELKKSAKPRGGKLGHKGAFRQMVETPDVTEQRHVSHCRRCNSSNLEVVGVSRHQVWEMPEIQAYVKEYQLQRVRCLGCSKTTTASLPEGVIGQFGPRLSALTGMLLSEWRQSTRQARSFLHDVMGVSVSSGGIECIKRRLSKTLRGYTEEIKRRLMCADSINMDETGWRIQDLCKRSYAWVMRSDKLTYFHITGSRGKRIAHYLTGGASFSGTVTSDRYGAYNDYPRRQICWAHLIRDFRRIEQRDGIDNFYGKMLLEYSQKLFEQWHKYKAGQITLEQCRDSLVDVRRLVEVRLRNAYLRASITTSRTAHKIWLLRDSLWRFLEQDIEPTNNSAERALRPLVINRKLSFGSQSYQSGKFVSSMMTLTQTIKQQSRPMFFNMVRCVDDAFHQRPYPL